MPNETVVETTARRLPTVIIGLLLGLMFTALAAMGGWGLTIDRRVTRIEVRQDGLKEDIQEMKADIKSILAEVRK